MSSQSIDPRATTKNPVRNGGVFAVSTHVTLHPNIPHMDFALERTRTVTPDSDSDEYLLEISWLFSRVVVTGSQIPVINLAYELVLPEGFIGECLSTAMDIGFLTAPKHGTFGGKITPNALRKLKQVGK